MTHGNCAYTRLIYASPLCGNQRVEESNLAAWVFETPPKGTLLAVRDSAKLRAIGNLQLSYVVTDVRPLLPSTLSYCGSSFNSTELLCTYARTLSVSLCEPKRIRTSILCLQGNVLTNSPQGNLILASPL